MRYPLAPFLLTTALFVPALLGCSGTPQARDTTSEQALSSKTLLDLGDVTANPTSYEWFDFRPNVKKLILAGAEETEHIAILWYTVPDGRVGLHRHNRTESVYVIDGSQTDGKGTYAKGTVYFNPPGSGHEITDSSGFFLLAYAAPPDFQNIADLADYTPVRIDTTDPELLSAAEPSEDSGPKAMALALDESGGMRARLLELTPDEAEHEFIGNYLLVLEGSCQTAEGLLDEQSLLVTKGVTPESMRVTAAGGPCRLLGVSF